MSSHHRCRLASESVPIAVEGEGGKIKRKGAALSKLCVLFTRIVQWQHSECERTLSLMNLATWRALS